MPQNGLSSSVEVSVSVSSISGVFDPRNVVSELRRAAVDFFHLPVQEKEKANTGGQSLGLDHLVMIRMNRKGTTVQRSLAGL